MSSLAVRLAGITKRYRSNTVLGPIDLDLKPGRVYGLIGENGAGKSTLIRILMGLSKPTSGTIETMDASTPDGLRRSRAQIGYVPDEPTNGLDPLGTIEIRELIKRLNRELGTTVLISSHNLSELHQTVTDYIILSSGALVAQLTAYDVDDLSGGDLEQLYARIMLGRDGRVSSRRGYPRGSASAWKGDHHDR